MFLLSFIALHMATHLSGLWGIDAYNSTQKLLRLIYRNPVAEPALLASAVFQIAVGLNLLIRNARRGLRGGWQKVQAISGGVFLLFFAQHLIAYVLARWIDGLNTNFYWPASVMSGPPFTWYFVPYYFLGVSSLFVHIACALRFYLLRSGRCRYASSAFWVVSGSGVAMALLINAMLLGLFYEIRLPDEWITYLRRYIPDYAR